jgi:hypothetical protein
MNPKDRAARITALDTIADEAENLVKTGADPISVQRFAIGARKELAKQKKQKIYTVKTQNNCINTAGA